MTGLKIPKLQDTVQFNLGLFNQFPLIKKKKGKTKNKTSLWPFFLLTFMAQRWCHDCLLNYRAEETNAGWPIQFGRWI